MIRPCVWLWVLWSGVQAIASLEGGLTTETPWRWLEESTALTEQDCRVDALASAAALYNGLRDRQIEAVFSAHDPPRVLAFDPQGHALGVWRWDCRPDDRPESRS